MRVLLQEVVLDRPHPVEAERIAYPDTLEQAIYGDEMGFHAFWTVEHHFLEEYSHCSNPSYNFV